MRPVFPEKVWAGESRSRQNLDNNQQPDHHDHVQIVAEINAIERFLLNLQDDLSQAPNVRQKFQEATAMLADLHNQVENLTPPEDLQNQLEALQSTVAAIDTRKAVAKLNTQMQLLLREYDGISKKVKRLESKLQETATAMRHELRNELNRMVAKTEERVQEVEEELQIIRRNLILEGPNV